MSADRSPRAMWVGKILGKDSVKKVFYDRKNNESVTRHVPAGRQTFKLGRILPKQPSRNR